MAPSPEAMHAKYRSGGRLGCPDIKTSPLDLPMAIIKPRYNEVEKNITILCCNEYFVILKMTKMLHTNAEVAFLE